jgi:hypothetical protein
MSKQILEYLKTGVEAIPDSIYGNGYRCSAYLTDGTFLPCVVLRKSEPVTDLALRRFEEEKCSKGVFQRGPGESYRQIVRRFVVSGNHVNHYDIASVEPSRFAIPLSLLGQIQGETSMGWTGFVLQMNDGKLFAMGTTFLAEFFNVPEGYSFNDVVAVHNHAYVSQEGELRELNQGMSERSADYDASRVLRERPYFVCYYDA